ncbi:PrpR N-terminal domain-containing protein [Clostridium sp. 19966]|uniref:sigma-54-dependent transcriptional regulator n=1 Tax=Clostridium sp. 19966 TaxID=2768166 RepID=UPI0028DD481A|nr:PrpR N-terminal domain-containing protein [Clostridium sp. 19966]MDT8717496.1 PrpR N-terminal domain-containing protein [Clostridium sp. 19966]
MKTKILFIAPYPGLKELTLSAADEYEDVEIDVYIGNYEKGPKLLKELEADKNYDAIITRGGTVETCRLVSNIPIIEIYINAFDILRILKLCQGFKGKKMFLAYPSIEKSFKDLSELMGYSIESKCYLQHAEVRDIIGELKEENYDLVIGDNIVYETAHEFKISSFLLTSGIEAVRSSIEEAIRLCCAISSNHYAVRNIDNYASYEKSETQKANINEFIRVLTPDEFTPSLLDTVFPQTILSQISELSATSLSTIITGEDGMCKNDAAYLCFCYGPQKKKNTVCINCYSMPEDYNYALLTDIIIDYLGNKGGTLFLEDIENLSKESQKKLTDMLKKINKDNNIKIIASCEFPIEVCESSGILIRSLRSILDEVRIELMPFKNYKHEIQNIISMYLGKLNVRCASQIVGIKDGGVSLLLEYDWPGNLRQFMRVINQLTLTCEGSYITENQIKTAIKREQDNYRSSSLVPIDISGSLKEIERRIIKQVFIEEGMNGVRVEKRLKIGHSTLWRKLK